METTDWSDAFDALMEGSRRAVRSAVVGRVSNYAHGPQTATVTPLVLESRRIDEVEYPAASVAVPDVPVIWPTGGARGMTMGLDDGALVLLVYRHRSHDEVDEGSTNPATPKSHRRMGLSDVVALAGFVAPATGQAAGNRDDNGQVVVYFPSGESVLFGDATADKALALATETKAHIDALQSAHDGHTHVLTLSAGTGSAAVTAAPVGPLGEIAASDILVRS